MLHYELWLDLTQKDLSARVEITLESLQDDLKGISLDAKELFIQSIEGAQAFTRTDKQVEILFAKPLSYRQRLRLSIQYQFLPSSGFKVFPKAVYTAFHTYQWMPCLFETLDRATFTLHLTTPEGWRVAGNGAMSNEENLHHSKLSSPYPAYLFGFAAGDFWEATRQVGGVTLTLLATPKTPREAEKFLQVNEDALRFFEEKSGLSYPETHYTMVLAPGQAAQEMAHFSVIGEAYAQELLQDETEDWLAVHELSHQWWGNWATCAHWGEFWLNEAFAVFMTAAYKEKRWGKEAYQREKELSQKRYQKLKDQGKDRALVLPNDTPSQKAGGSIVYSKGSLILFGARELMSEEGFWRAIEAYTKESTQRGATTEALRRMLEENGASSLGGLSW